MALDKKQQQTLVLVVMGVVGFFYVYWSYGMKPVNKKILERQGELQTILDQVESMKRTAQKLPALRREYDALVAEVGQTEKKLPKERGLEDILRIVTEQALKCRLAIANFSPGGGRQDAYYVEFPINLNFTGQFHTIGKFLAVLGAQERILSARNLTLNFSLNQRKGHTVSGSFTLLTYSYKG